MADAIKKVQKTGKAKTKNNQYPISDRSPEDYCNCQGAPPVTPGRVVAPGKMEAICSHCGRVASIEEGLRPGGCWGAAYTEEVKKIRGRIEDRLRKNEAEVFAVAEFLGI